MRISSHRHLIASNNCQGIGKKIKDYLKSSQNTKTISQFCFSISNMPSNIFIKRWKHRWESGNKKIIGIRHFQIRRLSMGGRSSLKRNKDLYRKKNKGFLPDNFKTYTIKISNILCHQQKTSILMQNRSNSQPHQRNSHQKISLRSTKDRNKNLSKNLL